MLHSVTITKVEAGYKIEPTNHLAASLQEAHRWIRAKFQVTPEEWSKLEQDLDIFGKASIERSSGKREQVS